MIDTIYIENEVADHPRTRAILERFPRAARISCERYGEVFNRSAQNFRLQKKRPALILARKHDGFVLDAPEGFGIGGTSNYYFSHMLNCLYDCRYCFLQGMFRSAHYLLFVNYEDFERGIDHRLKENPGDRPYFFSGYDCDSLALDSVTGFVDEFLPFFADRPRAWLELRTKSIGVRGLLGRAPLANVVVAFSLSPDRVARTWEHKTPSVGQRIEACRELAEAGWNVGFRFDPVIYHDGFEASYRELFDLVVEQIPLERLHSVSLGTLRFPKDMFDRMARLYPEEPLLAGGLAARNGQVTYGDDVAAELLGYCRSELARRFPEEILFSCGSDVTS